jgi:hypothetical protein
MRPAPYCAAILLAAASLAAAGSECRVASGPGTAALVELYTSEGCSSCPPADRWLSAFTKGKRDPRVVPIAFHVQYWDSLGWKDRFGDPRFTGRQETEGKLNGARFVYTPQVVLGGRDFPDWHGDAGFARAVEAIYHRRARATLEIVSRPADDGGVSGTVTAALAPGFSPTHVALVVALEQDGLSSRVSAGENRGEHLAHDFVARDVAISAVAEGRTTRDFAFKAQAEANPARTSITAFLQDTTTGEVIQALAAPPCR